MSGVGSFVVGGYPVGSAGGSISVPVIAQSGLAGVPDQRIYRAWLDDVELPIASLQLRLRAGSDSYLSVIVPDSLSYADAIISRPSGVLSIYQGFRGLSGVENLTLLAAGTLQNMTISEGANNKSVSLVAYGNNQAVEPAIKLLSGVSYQRSGTTGTSVRCRVDAFVRPGDSVRWAGGQMTADLISIFVGVSATGSPTETMEIS